MSIKTTAISAALGGALMKAGLITSKSRAESIASMST